MVVLFFWVRIFRCSACSNANYGNSNAHRSGTHTTSVSLSGCKIQLCKKCCIRVPLCREVLHMVVAGDGGHGKMECWCGRGEDMRIVRSRFYRRVRI